MDKAASLSKGTMVIATVKGDVHDIGKNLVDIILTNNGYKVLNLGIQCPLERMLTAAGEHKADAIGMSGLLVKSTLIMKENLEVMNERGLRYPVILGGAALTRRYVENDLRQRYAGSVYYANDAFDGLHYMEQIVSKRDGNGEAAEEPASVGERAKSLVEESASLETLSGLEAKIAMAPRQSHAGSESLTPAAIPTAPFWGSKVAESVPLDEVFRFINETALIRGQWQIRRGKSTESEYRALLDGRIYPELEALKKKVREERLL